MTTLLLTLLLMAVLLGWQWGNTLAQLWQTQLWLAAPLSLLTTAFVFVVGRALIVEYRAARRIDRLQQQREQLEQAMENDDLTTLHLAHAPTITALKIRQPALISEFEAAGDVDLEEVGRGLMASTGKRVAESAVMATRLRRLGKMTQRLCRPIPTRVKLRSGI